jgi:hypothetical protein
LREPRKQLGHVGGLPLRIGAGEAAPEHANHRALLEQQQVERDGGDVAGGKADHQQPAIDRQRAHGGLGQAATDGIIDHVDAFAVRQVLQALAQVVGRVVDGFVRAVRPAQFELLRCRGRRDYLRAELLADLDRGEADAAGCAEHEQRFAWPYAGAILEGVMGGGIGDQEARGLHKAHCPRDLIDALRERHGLLGVAAGAVEGEDAHARADMGHIRASLDDNTGHLAARREGKIRPGLILSFHHQAVEEIEPAGLDTDQHLAGTDGRRLDVLEAKLLSRFEIPAKHCFHRAAVFGAGRPHLDHGITDALGGSFKHRPMGLTGPALTGTRQMGCG